MSAGGYSVRHRETWDLIPWLVNGRLGDSERVAAEEHLRDCEACRLELDAQRQLHAAIAEDSRIDCVPSASLQRLWQRIDAGESGTDAPETDLSEVVHIGGRSPAGGPSARSWVRWLAAAAVVEAIALGAFAALWLSASASRPAPAADYRTVTSAAGTPAGAVVRAVFADSLTLAEMQTLLRDAGLRIVSGPTEAGVYALAPQGTMGTAGVALSLARLRSDRGVRFAEPIAAAVPDAGGEKR